MGNRIRIVRGLIQVVTDTVNNIKRFSGLGVPGETITNREIFQHYGFSSRPVDADEDSKEGAENIVLISGNVIFSVAEDDRRYRIAIEKGEVALYTDEGDKIHFKRNKQILVQSSNKITLDAVEDVEIINAKRLTATLTESADVTAPEATVTASTSAKVISPIVNLGVAAGHRTLVTGDFLLLYDGHIHDDPVAGVTSVPKTLSSTQVTVNTKAT